MKLNQTIYSKHIWQTLSETPTFIASQAQLVLAFGERKLLEEINIYPTLRERYPSAEIVINSTSGEIYGDSVHDDSIVVTAIEFDKTTIRTTKVNISKHSDSFHAGETIAKNLLGEDLKTILIISDGGKVNGRALIEALNIGTNYEIPISGGLAGDGIRFEKTLVGLNENPHSGSVIGIGLYSKNLIVGNGTMDGWDMFGPEREITKSEYNVLYEIGERAALDLYKEYLGKYAKGLPGAALLFPLSMRESADSEPLVRTILSIDEQEKSMTFAGEMPQGTLVRFMKANFDRVIDAASMAAKYSLLKMSQPPELALLISCVGRKLVLNNRIEEEIEAARDIFDQKTLITGFYSYGEFSPIKSKARSELYNQTMTITTLSEI